MGDLAPLRAAGGARGVDDRGEVPGPGGHPALGEVGVAGDRALGRERLERLGRRKRVGVDPQKFFAGIAQQSVKDQLKANTDEVIARGGFGSPTIFVDKTDMYFGNDRLPLVREALARRKERAA